MHLCGTTSTSISAALGMAIASNLQGEFDKQHIAVIEMLDSPGMALRDKSCRSH
jgi:1-deoxy-D-xylulose-5-phosphate synthase